MTREEFLKQLPELIKNYKPASDVASYINNLTLLMIVGPSGAGKTSLIRDLEMKYVVADNTRPPRPDEEEGADYYFRQDYGQVVEDIISGRFVQVAVDSGGDLKATRAAAYPSSGAAVMAVVADAVPIFRGLGFRQTISIFVTPPSYDEWMRRLNVHNLNHKQQISRLAEAARSLEFALHDQDIHFVLNDNLGRAVEQTKNILEGKVDEQREDQAKTIVQLLYGGLSYNKVL